MFSCVDCHKGVKAELHETTPPTVTCAQCHADQQAAYDRSYHAKAIRWQTQGSHLRRLPRQRSRIAAARDPKSSVNHANVPATCGRCHSQKFVMEASGHSAQPFMSYQESVHGRAISRRAKTARQSVRTATACTRSCRRAIPNRRSSNSTCPARAGNAIRRVETQFMQSIHGQALTRGNGQAPVCTDCHGIHSIKAHLDPDSSVSSLNVARTTCARCHEGVRLSQEFGVTQPIGIHLLGQLSRACFARRIPGGGELRQLPRRAQHSPLDRSALHHQQGQPGKDLRSMPSGSERTIHPQ